MLETKTNFDNSINNEEILEQTMENVNNLKGEIKKDIETKNINNKTYEEFYEEFTNTNETSKLGINNIDKKNETEIIQICSIKDLISWIKKHNSHFEGGLVDYGTKSHKRLSFDRPRNIPGKGIMNMSTTLEIFGIQEGDNNMNYNIKLSMPSGTIDILFDNTNEDKDSGVKIISFDHSKLGSKTFIRPTSEQISKTFDIISRECNAFESHLKNYVDKF